MIGQPSHILRKGFDSITPTSGVLVRAHRSGNPAVPRSHRATLRRSWPDEVNDVSLLRCLIPVARSIRLAMIAFPPDRLALLFQNEEPDDHRDRRQDDHAEPHHP